MELILEIEEKDLKFKTQELEGRGLDILIDNLEGLDVSKIIVSGKSNSYTFARQVALLVNILVREHKAEIVLKSPSFKVQSGILIPIYN